GELPEVQQSTTNSSLDAAQVIELPAAVNGVIKVPAATDYYRFHARKEAVVVLEVLASRTGSPLDSSLAVLNLEGKELARNEDANGLDSLIRFSPPAEGDYVVQLRDFRYQGGGEHKYRLYAGVIPCLESIFPMGGRRGETVELQLQGNNLASGENGRAIMAIKILPGSPVGITEVRAAGTGLSSNPRQF